MAVADPEVNQQISKRVVERQAERYHKAMQASLDQGFGIWALKSGPEIYRGIRLSTLDMDLPLVCTENYIDLFKAGVLADLPNGGQLASLTLWQQESEKVTQANMALPPGTPPQELTYQKEWFWGLLAGELPSWIFTQIQKKFIRLMKDEIEKGEAVA